MTSFPWLHFGVWASAYGIALGLSGPWVRWMLRLAGSDQPPEERNPGAVIGKLEGLIVVSLVIVDAYVALALVFAAKGMIRREMSERHSSYYVLGTVANFAWALVVALAARLAASLL